jgi:hypothetical protein
MLEFGHILAEFSNFALNLGKLVLGFFKALAPAANTGTDLLVDRIAGCRRERNEISANIRTLCVWIIKFVRTITAITDTIVDLVGR